MSDIFISYAREDRERVAPLAAALAERGWSVWWDRDIQTGKTFDQAIEEALRSARCVLVVWSRYSVGSPWVRAEATDAHERGVLIPVRVDAVELPLAFRQIQTADLVGWNGDRSHSEFARLVRDIPAVVGSGQQIGGRSPRPAERPVAAAVPVRMRLVLATVVTLALVVAAWMLLRSKLPSTPEREMGAPAPTLRIAAVSASPTGAPVAEPRQPGGETAVGGGLARLALAAAFVAGQANHSRDVIWRIFTGEPNALGERQRIHEWVSPTYEYDLPAGRYLVTAAMDAAKASQDVTVAAGQRTDVTLVLNAGVVSLSAALKEGGAALNHDVLWAISDASGRPSTTGKRIMGWSSPEWQYVVPAGRYLITATLDAAEAGEEVQVEPGQRVERRLVLNAGAVTLFGVAERGGPPYERDIVWGLYEAAPHAGGTRRRVGEWSSRRWQYFLAAGRYVATAQIDAAHGEREVEVHAGESQDVEVQVK